MKRIIYLITIFKTNNIGAVLQAYALVNVLEKYGKVSLVDIDNYHINKGVRLIRFGLTFKSILSVGKDILRLFSRKLLIKKFKSFIKKVDLIDINEIVENPSCYFFTGSDQIWNPDCISNNGKIDERYFFNNIKSGNIFSYATSKGSYKFSMEQEPHFFNLLKRFKKISVREKDFCDYLIQNNFNGTKHTLDPSLLFSKDRWLSLNFDLDKSIEKKLPRKFILVYTVPRKKLLNDLIIHVKNTLKLPIISIDQNFKTFKNVDIHLKSVGPEDFINLINKADFIITDSFHGTCFSINFNKSFITADVGVLSNRIKSLLSLLKLENRIADSDTISKFKSKKSFIVNFSKANNILIKQRKNSLKFIDECFN